MYPQCALVLCCRIRNTRNKLSHVSTNELTNSEFEAMWTGLVPSLIVFGSSKAEILQMKTCDLDPLNTKLWVNEVQLQDLRHQNEKAESRAAHKHKALCVLVALLILAIVAIFLTYFLIFKDPGPCSQYLLKWATSRFSYYALSLFYIELAGVPDIACVNKKDYDSFLISLLSVPFPPPLVPFSFLGFISLLHIPPFPLKVLVDLPVELTIQIPMKLSIKVPTKVPLNYSSKFP